MKNALIILSLISIFISGVTAQNPLIKNFTVSDGLPSNTVYQVIKDRNNFLWFISDAGVSRYDGTGFTNFSKKDGLSSNDVIRVKEDMQGRIWFFNFNGTVNYFYRNKIFTPADAPFLDSLKSNHFYTDFFQDADSIIYFLSFSSNLNTSLNLSNEVKKIKIPCESIFIDGFEIASISARFISRSPQNDFLLWSSMGLHKWNDFEDKPVLISDTIGFKSVYQVKDNKFIFQAGYHSDTTSLLIELVNGIPLPPVLDPVDHKKTFTSVVETDDNLLWFVTKERGVFVMKDFRVINHLAISEGQGIVQDHEGNVWITTSGHGVYRISPYFNDCNHLKAGVFDNRGIIKLHPYRDEGIWMTNGKRVYLRKDCDFYSLNFSTEKSLYDQIYYLKNNSLIIGKGSYIFYQLREIEPDTSTKIIGYLRNSKETPLAGFKTITMGKTTNKICSSLATYLIFFNEYGYYSNTKKVYLNERIHNIFYNREDELVVNARKNYLYQNGQFERHPALAKFDGQIITQYLPINDSVEAFLIEGDSIFLTCNHRFCNLTAFLKPGISGKIIKIYYHDETLFIVTTENIFVCRDPAKIHLSKSVDLRIVDVNFSNIHDFLIFQDSLYVASGQGLTLIPLRLIDEMNVSVPIPYIKSVQVNGEETDIGENRINLKGKNRLKISFGSINYSSMPLVYAYKLNDSDEDWTIESATEVIYQDLPPDDYIFEVKVQKPGADFSQPAVLYMQIRATLWQQPLFYAGIFLLVAGWFFWSFHRRQRRKRKLLEMDNQLITLEQKALQSMMNPHFIFNVLGSIQNYLLHSNPNQAGIYLSQFARLIRQNVNAINSNKIPIEEEADRLRNYLDLERLRLENSFNYEIGFDENLDDEEELLIPSMIVQPYVENAVWHGIAVRKNDGFIRIIFSQHSPKALKIIIEDNGPGIKSKTETPVKGSQHLQMGTQITRKRLELLGKKYHIQTEILFEEAFAGDSYPGTRVTIVVPLL